MFRTRLTITALLLAFFLPSLGLMSGNVHLHMGHDEMQVSSMADATILISKGNAREGMSTMLVDHKGACCSTSLLCMVALVENYQAIEFGHIVGANIGNVSILIARTVDAPLHPPKNQI